MICLASKRWVPAQRDAEAYPQDKSSIERKEAGQISRRMPMGDFFDRF